MLQELMPSRAARLLLLARQNVEARMAGDVEGHEFHGNQWTTGASLVGGHKLELSERGDTTFVHVRMSTGSASNMGRVTKQADGYHAHAADVKISGPHATKGEAVKAVLERSGFRSASRHPETAIHAAADAHLAKLSVAVRYAFARGRKALGKDANVVAATKAVRAALEDVLPGALLGVLKAGGDVGVALLTKKMRVAGDVPGHEFHGNQYVYHGTSVENLHSIKEHGLRPNERGNPLNFHHVESSSRDYGDILLRVKKTDLPDDVRHDSLTSRSWTLKTVSREKIEVEHAPGQWRALELRVLKRPLAMRFDATNPAAVAWAKDHAAELAKNLSETTEQVIKDAIARVTEEGDLDQAYDVIEAAVGDDARAELIARTEVMTAANEGQRQAWDQATDEGLLTGDERVAWIATADACPLCEELDGAERDLDGEYPDDGGEGPPLHPNCRCTEGIV